MPFYEVLESGPYVQATTGSDYNGARGEGPREGTAGLGSGTRAQWKLVGGRRVGFEAYRTVE
jgi:hypothetical protein